MTLEQLQSIKRWHLAHRSTHPVENRCWDIMLTLWLFGWVGLLPAVLFGSFWLLPFCLVAHAAPSLYVAWRVRQHKARRLRCDWLAACTVR